MSVWVLSREIWVLSREITTIRARVRVRQWLCGTPAAQEAFLRNQRPVAGETWWSLNPDERETIEWPDASGAITEYLWRDHDHPEPDTYHPEERERSVRGSW